MQQRPAASGSPSETLALTTLDDVARGLARLRLEAGAISFTEVAARIQRRREDAGMSSSAARVPRSTVYDAFRTGRQRIDPSLVGEIVSALGGDDAAADEWRAVAIQVMLEANEKTAAPAPDSTPKRHASPSGPFPLSAGRGTTSVLAVFVACVFVNIVAHVPVDPLGLPIYLDMIGTAIGAIVLGPVAGAAVGLTSNLLSSTVHMDWPGMWFALVNAAGGFLWGIGYHRWRMRTIPRFLLLCAIVALGCTMVAVPILVFVFGGSSGTSQDSLLSIAGLVGTALWTAVFSSNMLTSLADKVISGVLALTVSTLALRVVRRIGDRAS